MRAVAFVLLTAAPAVAQYPAQPPGGFAPNYFNRQTQPLSPYLNLFRGSNPATNYYYGVRPGLPSGGLTPFGTVPQPQPQLGTLSGGFLPQASTAFDINAPQMDAGGQPVQLRSAGHTTVYGNQFNGHGGYQAVYAQAINRGGFQAGGGLQRPALGGLGSSNRRPTPPPTR